MSDRPAVQTDRLSACYDVGETVTFHVEAPEGVGELCCALTWDGYAPIREVRLPASADPAVVRVRGDQPGFLRLTVTSEDGTLVGEAAAAIAPEHIEPSLPAPEDFDTFWQSKRAPWQGVPLDAEVSSRPGEEGCRVEAVRLPTPDGETIHGWLMRPEAPGPFTALVLYHGAGVYAVGSQHGKDWVRHGYMVFSINPHPISNEEPQEFYVALREGALADYRTRGRDSRDSLYFVPMFLRASLAVDYLAAHPDWNGKHLHVEGHSHGGGQALAAAMLNPKVTAISVSCSTHCDHTGPVIGRVAGWPQMVEVRDGVPDARQVEACRYIDGVNFASRIRQPALFGVCFLDKLCPPTGLYAAYNVLQGPKTVYNQPLVGHLHTDVYREVAFRWAEVLASSC